MSTCGHAHARMQSAANGQGVARKFASPPHICSLAQSPETLVASSSFERDLVTFIPHMRAFARSLCGAPSEADDLAQDALAKALRARASYQMGTNMKAWLFMIVRNQFFSDKRRSWRATSLDPEVAERTLVARDDPDSTLALDDVRQALQMLPDSQREALIMVGAGGLSYEEAAEVAGVAVGTVKSRVSRARRALLDVLETGAFKRDGAPASDAMRSLMAAVSAAPDRRES